MSEELIKRLRDEADILTEHGFEYAPEVMREAADALSSPAQAVQVPDGWKLVPTVGTQKMLYAGVEYGIAPHVAARVFTLMLAASPTPATVATHGITVRVDDTLPPGTMKAGGATVTNLAPATVATENVAQVISAEWVKNTAGEDAEWLLRVRSKARIQDGATLVTLAHGARPVRFVCVNPLALTDGAHLPMFRDSWRFAFWEQDGQLCFGMRDDGPLVAYDAVHRRQSPPECMACSETWICQGEPGCKAGKPVAQGGGVDADWLSAVEEVLRISDRKHDAWEKVKAGLPTVRALLSASPAGVGGVHLPQWAVDCLLNVRQHGVLSRADELNRVTEYLHSSHAAPAIDKQGEGE